MEGALETLDGSATISSEDAGVKGDCNKIFSVSGAIGKSSAEPVANNDFTDDVIISSRPFKDGMLVENDFNEIKSSNKKVPEMVADSMDNLEAEPETTDDGA